MTYVVTHPFDEGDEIEFVTRNKERAIEFARSLANDSNKPTLAGCDATGDVHLFLPEQGDVFEGEAAD